MLKNCRQFYRLYPQIRQCLAGEFERTVRLPAIRQSPIGECNGDTAHESRTIAGSPTPLAVDHLLRLSWTHLIELIHLDEPWKRAFYENECLAGNWSVP